MHEVAYSTSKRFSWQTRKTDLFLYMNITVQTPVLRSLFFFKCNRYRIGEINLNSSCEKNFGVHEFTVKCGCHRSNQISDSKVPWLRQQTPGITPWFGTPRFPEYHWQWVADPSRSSLFELYICNKRSTDKAKLLPIVILRGRTSTKSPVDKLLSRKMSRTTEGSI